MNTKAISTVPKIITRYDSPMSLITLACDGDALTGLWIEGQTHYAATLSNPAEIAADSENLPEVLKKAILWLKKYFSGEQPAIDFPLAPKGTPFRQKVWEFLLSIPYGQTITYGEISKALNTGCAQAVGGAVGHNPISIIIPCHRVIGTNGNLTGYAGGIDKKIRLLEIEGVDMSQMFYKKET